MKNMTSFYQKWLIPITFTLTTLISGCHTVSLEQPKHPQPFLPVATKNYLQVAPKTEHLSPKDRQLLAIYPLLIDNKIDKAKQELDRIPDEFPTSNLSTKKSILMVKLYLKNNDLIKAKQQLDRVHSIRSLPNEFKVIYYANATEVYFRTNRIEKSITSEIFLNSLLNNSPLSRNIWHTLQTLPLKTINTLKQQTQSNLILGWLDLAILSKQYANQPARLTYAIQNWQNKYPHHPAQTLIPPYHTLMEQNIPPTHIALLLPLQGAFGKMGQAVRDGFMTAFYEDAKTSSQTLDIKVYDTAQSDVRSLYHQAHQDGATVIIGPLTKTNVEKMAQTQTEIPILALNYLPISQDFSDHLIQFGLSPKQAAEQVAIYARRKGINQILTITPQNKWGFDVQQAFTTRWHLLGGSIVYSLNFSNDQLPSNIATALHIDQSTQRAKILEKSLGQPLKIKARRRQDIDGIFLAGTPMQAKQIQPLLKFYYAGNIPVFAISSLYSGYTSNKNRDLNGIYFEDIPWVLADNSLIATLKKRIHTLWPTDYKTNNRLYALGIDSYLLTTLLPRLKLLPNFPVHGVTGQLYLKPNGQIYSQHLFARFNREGYPRLLA